MSKVRNKKDEGRRARHAVPLQRKMMNSVARVASARRHPVPPHAEAFGLPLQRRAGRKKRVRIDRVAADPGCRNDLHDRKAGLLILGQ